MSRGACALLATLLSLVACNAPSVANDGDGAAPIPEETVVNGATVTRLEADPQIGAEQGLPAQERASAMRGAGFFNPKADSRWTWRDPDDAETLCEEVWAEIEEVRDLNGDGQLEAVVKADGDQCWGMNQHFVTVLHRTSGGWVSLIAFQARFANYGFHARPGIAWPDVEIASGEETGCVDFLRWNGRTYIDGGTSDEGRVCTLTPEGRAAGGAHAPARGAVAFPPIEKGYYAIGVTCAEAAADPTGVLMYLDQARVASFDGGQRVQGVEALGGDRYRFRGADMVITVSSRTTFTDEHGDRHTHCPTGQIPRGEREDWGDLSGR
ncbi:hypothetical protein ACFPIF_12445 [Brevundimonas faecalis]|uniref:hypothetical protein n=1 Tax=Brevundimonas faecalis TaxID=947378 RepID=UPI00360E9226